MTAETVAFARTLRKADNAAERAMWSALKSRQLGGFKFTRQFPIGPYFADFVCRESMLVIELDGSQHQDAAAYDHRRDEYMLACGYDVMRVPSATALLDLSGLGDTILAALEGQLDDVVDAPDLVFRRSTARSIPRGLRSRNAMKRVAG